MDYIEKAKNEIRNQWFENHVIKSIKGEVGFQEIIWGRPGTSMYQVRYVLTGNMVYLSGDLGVAAYSLTGSATLKELSQYGLSYFSGKLVASQRAKYEFDGKLARKQIKEYFLEWCDVEDISKLNSDDEELYDDLIRATNEWNLPEHFNTAVYHIYQSTTSEWFDSEMASSIADLGQRLSYSVVSYWLGLQMINEQLKEKELQTA
ncbi:hypothetical protein ACIQ6U_09730 [Lysinibacillus fusiformis]|uniref:hypothetical protein n=1 Tax=Lysinibacillus fusiformis TaxID=28031 RepID=UPI003808FC13